MLNKYQLYEFVSYRSNRCLYGYVATLGMMTSRRSHQNADENRGRPPPRPKEKN